MQVSQESALVEDQVAVIIDSDEFVSKPRDIYQELLDITYLFGMKDGWQNDAANQGEKSETIYRNNIYGTLKNIEGSNGQIQELIAGNSTSEVTLGEEVFNLIKRADDGFDSYTK